MSNDLELYSGGGDAAPAVSLDGDIQPFTPSPPLQFLQPLQPLHDLTNPEKDQYQWAPEISLFGQALPGVTQQQVDLVMGDLARTFQADFQKLGYPNKLISAACYFMRENATKKPFNVVQKHSFDLHGHDDWLGNAFANKLVGLPGANREKQQFLTAALQWLTKASKLAGQQVGTQAQGSAPKTSDPLDSLNDQQYEWVIKANQAAAIKTETALRRKWGDSSYAMNIQVAQEFLNHLPPNERQHFEQYTTGWIHAMNTVEVVEGLFNMAIGAGNIPTSGGAVQAEINQIENLMRTPATRRAYLADNQLQGRLRTLYDIRDKGSK